MVRAQLNTKVVHREKQDVLSLGGRDKEGLGEEEEEEECSRHGSQRMGLTPVAVECCRLLKDLYDAYDDVNKKIGPMVLLGFLYLLVNQVQV